MMMGMLMTGSSNISEIGRSLNEDMELKHTTKRLERMLTHENLLEVCNQLCLEEVVNKIDAKTIIALDGGDITHQYGEKFENQNIVRDGSKSKQEKGYWLNQISGYNENTKETFPVALDIYSTSEKGFKSANTECFELVNSTLDLIGTQGLWVMDRGYDSGLVLDYFLSRNLIFGGKSVKLNILSKSINRRVIYNRKCRYGNLKAELQLKGRNYKVTLICFKDKRNKEPILFLVNGWIKSNNELKRRIRGYFRRWGVEESYRFEKQGFGIEKATLRKFSRIKTLIGLTLLSWLLLIKINETPKLKAVILKQAKMEKNKPKQQPKFIYYRLLKGVQKLFASISELFRFR
jgi:hypothetical protein